MSFTTGGVALDAGQIAAMKAALVELGAPAELQVTVSSADILALFSSPKTIIPAPGVGKAIQVLDFIYEYKFNTTAYTIPGGVVMHYQGSEGVTGGVDGNVLDSGLAASVSTFGNAVMSQDAAGATKPLMYDRTAVENKAVKLFGLTANPTLGNGVLYLTIRYRTYTFLG